MDITSFIMGYNKGKSASGGGGSGSAVVWFVSFMGADGSLLFKMPVLDGDDCKNPVTHGDITTPTKESTVQYDYSYSGWSLTEGGAASSTALTNVTEDRTVYAAFTSAVRYYTVRFYDGETLLKTEQIAYGGSSTYEHEKENHLFEGWNPEPTNVTSDMDCYGTWVESYTFADASWEYIAQMSESGNASKVFAIGDEKTITVGSEEVTLVIADFDYDVLYSDKTTPIGMTLVSKDTYGDAVATPTYLSSNETIFWKNTNLSIYNRITTLKNNLPSDLSAVLKTALVKSSRKWGEDETEVHTLDTSDTVRLLSRAETYDWEYPSTHYYGTERTQDRVLALFEKDPTAYSCASGNYWTRSVASGTGYHFVNSAGASCDGYTKTNRVRFAICI